MNKWVTIISSLFLFLVGGFLLQSEADRLFITLPPTTGDQHSVTMASGSLYAQDFIVHQENISRFGIYARPLTNTITGGAITVTLLRDNTVVGSGSIPALVVMEGGASTVRLTPSIPTTDGEKLQVQVSISPELHAKIGLETRVQDDTFNQDAVFYVNGERQPDPLAYEAHYAIKPAIPLYVGGLLVLAAVVLISRVARISSKAFYVLYALGITAVANIPLFVAQTAVPYVIVVLQVLVVWAVLRTMPKGVLLPGRIISSHVIAFTPWWLLVRQVGKPAYDFFYATGVLHWKDLFFDPNQIPLLPAAAYVGIPVGILAIIGYFSVRAFSKGDSQRTLHRYAIALLTLGLFISPLLTAIGISLAAGMGLSNLHKFLGTHDKLATVIVYALIYIISLDTFTVYSRLIEAYI